MKERATHSGSSFLFGKHMEIPYYRAMDGLRAVAVGIVLLAHAGSPFPLSGGVGVDMFFVLSGFLITSILVSQFRTNRLHFRYFYIRRLLRLTPCLVLTCILVFLGEALLTERLDYFPIVCAMTYTSNWVLALTDSKLGCLSHCWSLSIEEQFYLMCPWGIFFLERSSKSLIKNAAVLALLCLGIVIYRCAMVYSFTAQRIYFGLDTHMDGILLGGAIAYLTLYLQSAPAWKPTLQKLLAKVGIPIALASLLAVMSTLQWWHPWMGRFGYFVVNVAAGIVVLELANNDKFSFIRRPLEITPLVYIGKISYGLYLLHFPAFKLVDWILQRANISMGLSATVLLKVCLAIVVATASYYIVEERFLRLKSRFVAKKEVSTRGIEPPSSCLNETQ